MWCGVTGVGGGKPCTRVLWKGTSSVWTMVGWVGVVGVTGVGGGKPYT